MKNLPDKYIVYTETKLLVFTTRIKKLTIENK